MYKTDEAESNSDSDQVIAAFAQASTTVWGEDPEAPSFLPAGADNTVSLLVCEGCPV